MRYSARVSRLGPGTATYTPSRKVICKPRASRLAVARSSKDSFGAMLAVGIVGLLFWPAAINVAMVLGLAPVIGVPLPLISYGGTALLASLIALGLLASVSMRRFVF